MKSSLTVREPFVTIAGQSAPGDGICLKNYGFSVATHDVVVRHMRFRPGDELGPEYKKRGKGFSPDAVSINSPSHNVIFDHCSASWSIDECLSVSGAGITNVTVQWCIISESLDDSFHEKGPHGYGSLLRTNGKVSFHHNIYAHRRSRSPRPGTYGDGSILLDFRNNVIYDSTGYSAADPVRMNYVGNYIRRPRGAVFRIGGEATRIYAKDNYLDGKKEQPDDNWRLISGAKPGNKQVEPFPFAKVKSQSAQAAFESTLFEAGATLPKRDAVDARVIRQIQSSKGNLIDSQDQVGGWPRFSQAEATRDSDNDGMPDSWERKYKLNPNAPDGNKDTDRDGFTDIEEFLNRADPKSQNES
ncbi:MAG: pectate lyase [Planctomycetaceae bacterium]|nr:pectate lyase [Planctomycetaceae bacterium]